MSEKKFAKIITDNLAKELDRLFTYEIPKEYIISTKVGMRVLVPFGRNNKLIEGIIMEISDDLGKETKFNIKKIEYFLEKEPSLNFKQLEMIKWIRKEYLCKYVDVIRIMLPMGINVKLNKVIKLKKEIEEKDEISCYINGNKNVSVEKLEKKFGRERVKKLLNKLIEDEYIFFIEDIGQKENKLFKSKIYRNYDDFTDVLPVLSSRAKKQREIIEYLEKVGDGIEITEIQRALEITKNPIEALVERRLLKVKREEEYRNPIKKNIDKYEKHILNFEQRKAYEKIIKSDKKLFMLKGVTGSGKTEVYLQLIEDNLKKDKNAIVLVPEISLTLQTLERFVGRFGKKVAVFHSKLSAGERFDEWRRIKREEAKIVIGTRSALFTPFENIGLIIIDEEHEGTYKSEQNPKYDTIEVAEKMTDIYDAKLILGSATPLIRDFHKTESGKLELLELKNRVRNISLPKVEIVNMSQELSRGNKTIFSEKLFNSIKEKLSKKEQVILFLNSRGFSKIVKCRNCGYTVECNYCDISMTYHEDKNIMICHYCGETKRVPNICPKCSSKYIRYIGIGTQKVEEEVKKYFPKATIARMDADTMRKKGSYERVLDKVKDKSIDILIGTQMISKGLDFPNITLVGIILADVSLNIPSYIAHENTFQLITQVSGRAGRSDKKGEVIVQTYNPDNYAIVASKNSDYDEFYFKEIQLRKIFNYPPFCNLIDITVSGEDEKKTYIKTEEISEKIKEYYKNNKINGKCEISKANNACISKIRKRYRFKILIKVDNEEKYLLKEIVKKYCIDEKVENNSDIIISVDVSPRHIL